MRLPRKCSIRNHADFAKVRKTGQAKAGRFVILSTLADPSLATIRTAFITTKRVSKRAHDRNLLRRRFRSFVQKHAPDFSDMRRFLITIARQSAVDATFAELEADWLRQARRLGLLKPTEKQP